jgi:NDP-sugar pyrophosphorylase family protein
VVEVAINLHHHPRVLAEFVGDGAAFGVQVTYSMETEILGTAGALRPLRWFFAAEEAFVILYGDVLTDLPLRDVVDCHRAAGADVSIVLTRVEDPTRAGIVAFDGSGRVTRFVEKPHAGGVFSPWANAGVYVCGPAVLRFVAPSGAQDFGRELFPAMLAAGRHLRAHPTDALVIDFGAPERLAEADAWVRRARPEASPC